MKKFGSCPCRNANAKVRLIEHSSQVNSYSCYEGVSKTFFKNLFTKAWAFDLHRSACSTDDFNDRLAILLSLSLTRSRSPVKWRSFQSDRWYGRLLGIDAVDGYSGAFLAGFAQFALNNHLRHARPAVVYGHG